MLLVSRLFMNRLVFCSEIIMWMMLMMVRYMLIMLVEVVKMCMYRLWFSRWLDGLDLVMVC